MNKFSVPKLIVFLWIYLLSMAVYGEQTEKSGYRHIEVDPALVEEFAADNHFYYEVDTDLWAGLRQWFVNWINSLMPQVNMNYSGNSIIYILLALLIVIVILMIVFGISPSRIFVSDQRLYREKYGVVTTDVPLDINNYIKTSLEKGQYREAVRGYFLLALEQLDQAQLINRDSTKTNYHYLIELSSNQNAYNIFFNLNKVYQQIWYGEKDAYRETVDEVGEYTEQLKALIKTAHAEK